MNRWLSQHQRALALATRRLVRAPLATALTILAIGITLSLPAGLYVLLQNVSRLAGGGAAEPQISLFLTLGAGKQDVALLKSKLEQHPQVREARFVSRDQALQELKKNAGLGDVVDTLQRNPLPDAFVVTSKSADPATLDQLRDEMRQWPKVAHAQLDSAWANRLDALVKLGRDAVLLLAVLLGVALAAVAGNTIRLQIFSHREEIEVSRLIGATDPYIRRPFLYFGALQGIGGGLMAWLILSQGIGWIERSVAQLAALYASPFQLSALSLSDSLLLIFLSAGLSWIGAFLAVRSHLRHADVE